MKDTPAILTHRSMIIRSLRITTRLRLHPEVVTAPRAFARRRKVSLVDDIFPETDFRKDANAADIDERIEEIKSNIHLVRHGAIRLFTKRDAEGDWIQSIELNPSQLLYEVKRHPHAKGDLPLSLNSLRKQVAPLLADPQDARHIVPGLVQEVDHIAQWSKVDSDLHIPAIHIRCLHNLSHPLTGTAEGVKSVRIQLGDKKDDCVIRIKEAKLEIDDVDGGQSVEGIRVRLILQGRGLTNQFAPFGTTVFIDENRSLVSFTEPSIAQVHQSVMARMEGTFLPVPSEWRNPDVGKPMTNAKALALVSQLTSIPTEELLAMDKDIRHPSESTTTRLKEELEIEISRLTPFPVSTLFNPSVYANQTLRDYPSSDNIDPKIADAYSGA